MQTLTGSPAFRLEHRQVTRALAIAFAALVVVVIAWNIQALDPLLYPFRLFVTYVHEAGHGLAAEISGGDVIRFVVYPSGAGVATTAGGSRWLILPAGYIGAALFGAALFYLANTWQRSRWLSVILGVGLVMFSLRYAAPTEQGAPTAMLVGLGFGAALLAAAWRLTDLINLLILDVLAMLTGLNAVLDLRGLIENSNASLGQVRNDAAAFSEQVLRLPPALIAIIWALIAVTLLGVSVYFSVYRPLRRAEPDAPAVPAKQPQDESIIDILKRGR